MCASLLYLLINNKTVNWLFYWELSCFDFVIKYLQIVCVVNFTDCSVWEGCVYMIYLIIIFPSERIFIIKKRIFINKNILHTKIKLKVVY